MREGVREQGSSFKVGVAGKMTEEEFGCKEEKGNLKATHRALTFLRKCEPFSLLLFPSLFLFPFLFLLFRLFLPFFVHFLSELYMS